MPRDPVPPVEHGFTVGAHSEVGERSRNEDSQTTKRWEHLDPEGGVVRSWLMAVADGLGGHPRGDEASAAAIASLEGFEPAGGASFSTEDLKAAFRAARESVEGLHPRAPSVDPWLHGAAQPATTLTVATRTGDGELRIANLGDSRAYVVAADGKLLFSSTPHNSLRGYVSKCLGDCQSEEPDVRGVRLPEKAGGVVVVCATDGVWVPLTGHGDENDFAGHVHEVHRAVGGHGQRIAEQLTSDAVSRVAVGADNATATVAVLQS